MGHDDVQLKSINFTRISTQLLNRIVILNILIHIQQKKNFQVCFTLDRGWGSWRQVQVSNDLKQ
jgi:hypothetical protein